MTNKKARLFKSKKVQASTGIWTPNKKTFGQVRQVIEKSGGLWYNKNIEILKYRAKAKDKFVEAWDNPTVFKDKILFICFCTKTCLIINIHVV